MAASSLPAPGTKYGPCEGECAHTDCAATRAMADRNCAGCAEKIGYDQRFFREDDGSLLHMKCWTPPETCEDRSFACCEKLTNDEHLARYGYVSAGRA